MRLPTLLLLVVVLAIGAVVVVRIRRQGSGRGLPRRNRPQASPRIGRPKVDHSISPPSPAPGTSQAGAASTGTSSTTPVKPSASRAPGVFISYRRQDTPHLAGRLYDRLGEHFGQERVFMDVDSIEPGLDFAEVIRGAVSSSAVMLVLIGDKWLTTTDSRGRQRLDNPDDYVRLELESALAREMRVIPVLVEGAAMPGSQELPGSLAGLARRNALEVTHGRFSADAERLISVIERIFSASSP
jgi:TIR domain